MQGMMIQDLTTVPEPGGSVVAAGQKELPEQPFGEVLGTETGKAEAKTEQAVVEQGVPEAVEIDTAEGTAQNSAAETGAAPFLMAALIDQGAAFIQPSENSERVAAAEQVQELISSWLQSQQGDEESGEELLLDETTEPDNMEEVFAAAREILDQLVEEKPQEEPDPELEQSDTAPAELNLNAGEIEELKQLMAVMIQTGQVPESLQNQPLAAELQPRLDKVLGLVAAKSVAGTDRQEAQLVVPNATEALNSETEAGAETLPPTESLSPETRGGLQEEQIAKILTPRREQPSPHEQKSVKAGPETQLEASAVVESELETASESKPEAAKISLQGLGNNTHQPQQAAQAVQASHIREAQMESPVPRMMQLPSGQQLAETQLVDQVVTHLAGSNDGETGRMRLRLNPAELGSLRLDLMVEGDRVRAHLQAQSQQVREVLDRYLPQLRDALQQQGLKIDEFRVDVQSGQDQTGNETAWQQQQQQQHHSPQSPWLADDWQRELDIPLEQLLEHAGGGISLRV